MRWTLDADEEVPMVRKSDPGNVDLLNTMPLPAEHDSAIQTLGHCSDAKKHRGS